MGKPVVNPLYIVKNTYRCETPLDFNKAFFGWQGKFSGRSVPERLTIEHFDTPPDYYPCVVRFSETEGQYSYEICPPWAFRLGGSTHV